VKKKIPPSLRLDFPVVLAARNSFHVFFFFASWPPLEIGFVSFFSTLEAHYFLIASRPEAPDDLLRFSLFSPSAEGDSPLQPLFFLIFFNLPLKTTFPPDSYG